VTEFFPLFLRLSAPVTPSHLSHPFSDSQGDCRKYPPHPK
jgi:hypothetical protein